MKKILLFLLFLLVPTVVKSEVPVYNYGGGCNYCVFYDYTNDAEMANLIKGDIKTFGFNLGLNTIAGIYLLGYDLMDKGYVSDIEKYFTRKIQF